MKTLKDIFKETLIKQLSKSAIASCSEWALKYRIMGEPFPGPFSFRRHPWLKGMHDSTAELNIGQKAAQMGFTETMLNVVFYSMEIKNWSVLYVLPSKHPDASNFSAARFDPALEMSQHLTEMFSDVKNLGHKQAGAAALYIRGARSRSGLKSIPVSLIILDEVDEMPSGNVDLAMQRSAGQREQMIWMISTPTVPKKGINKRYEESSQEHFMFKCPSCSKFIEFLFPESFEINFENPDNSRLKCTECDATLPHEDKPAYLSTGIWVPTNNNKSVRGFHVNHLYSIVRTPGKIAAEFIKSKHDPMTEQEFYNSILGLPFVAADSQITDSDFMQCYSSHVQGQKIFNTPVVTMGVDVGGVLHYEITEWKQTANLTRDLSMSFKPSIIKAGEVKEFEELSPFFSEFGIRSCVVDANPERRAAYKFAQRHRKRIRLCFYTNNIQGRLIKENDDGVFISVDRTSQLDAAISRFKGQNILVPKDIPEDYKMHVKNLVRRFQDNKQGVRIAKYVETGPDHFAHARNYSEIALNWALGAASQDITERVL